jgi:plastocyanin
MVLMSGAIAAIIALGCGGGSDGSTEPASSVLTRVEIRPASSSIYTTAPQNTVQLTVDAKDQFGAFLTGLGSPSFSSDNQAVASVASDGVVLGKTAGTAQVTASLTAGGVTRTATTTITVLVPPPTASVTAPDFTFVPLDVHVQSGGVVTWSIGAIHHSIVFTTPDSPPDVPELLNASANRTFTSAGTYQYHCSIHPSMTGTVVVH